MELYSRLNVLVSLSALALLTSCAPQLGGTEAEGQLREVAEVIMNDNFAANQIDPMEPYIAEDVSVFGPSGRILRVGKAPMMESLRRGAAEKTTTRWEERDWHIQVYGDVGIVSFLYDHDGTRNEQEYKRSQRATYVFHRSNGRWLLVHDHTSALPAEPVSETTYNNHP